MKSFSAMACALAIVLAAACGSTDPGITTAVKSKLAADEAVKAYQIDVDTREGVVTLNGTVDSVVARARAVQLTRESDGVVEVVDNIRVSDAVATSGVHDDIDDAGDAAARRVRDGADSVSDATRRTGSEVQRSVQDSDVDEKAEDAAREGGNAVVDGAKKVGSATKKGAEAVADGAKTAATGIRDAVTDDDPDTDKDGK